MGRIGVILCYVCVSVVLGCGGSSNLTAVNLQVSLTATPDRFMPGDTVKLTWESLNARRVSSSNFGAAAVRGSAIMAPTETTTYMITVEDAGGATATARAKVTLDTLPGARLTVSPASILYGDTATLSWQSRNATAVVDSNFAATNLSGSRTVAPLATTTYALTVRNAAGDEGTGSCILRVQRPKVSVEPEDPVVAPGATIAFTATVTGAVDTRVVWEIIEGGGSITDAGTYTAPWKPGICYLQVRSVIDPSADAVVRVDIIEPGDDRCR